MDIHNRNIDTSPEKRFRLLLFLFRLGGIPVCMEKIPKIYYLYRVTTVISVYATFIGNILDTFVHVSEMKETMSSIRVFSALSEIVLIHIVISIRRRKIEELIYFTGSFIWEDLPTKDSETGYLTQAGLLTRIKKIIKCGVITLGVFHVIQTVIRVIRSREAIFNIWYPFDIYSSPAYEIIFISHIFSSIALLSIFTDTMLLFSTLVLITCSQLEKLGGKLASLKMTNAVSQKMSVGAKQNRYDEEDDHIEVSFLHMQNQLKECIKFHQLILEFMEMLENNLHLLLGGILLLNLMALLLSAFSVIMNWGDFTDISQGVVGYIFLSANVCILCVTGTLINKEAEKVKYAAWDCDWIGAPIPFQRSVLFIIARANKEFTLTAAKFVPVSMTTFMNIMQQTLSYFMFLMEMRNSGRFAEDISN